MRCVQLRKKSKPRTAQHTKHAPQRPTLLLLLALTGVDRDAVVAVDEQHARVAVWRAAVVCKAQLVAALPRVEHPRRVDVEQVAVVDAVVDAAAAVLLLLFVWWVGGWVGERWVLVLRACWGKTVHDDDDE